MKENFIITGVWKNASQVITHLLVHSWNGKSFFSGVKTTEADLIKKLEAGSFAQTMLWNYFKAGWYTGQNVEIRTRNSRKYLTTISNNTVTDNLDNLPTMDTIHS